MDLNEKWGANASVYFGYTSTVGQDIFCRTIVRRHNSTITRDEGMIEEENAMILMIGWWRTKKGMPSNSTSFEWFITSNPRYLFSRKWPTNRHYRDRGLRNERFCLHERYRKCIFVIRGFPVYILYISFHECKPETTSKKMVIWILHLLV